MLSINELNNYIANLSGDILPIFAYIIGVILVFYIADHLIFYIKTLIK